LKKKKKKKKEEEEEEEGEPPCQNCRKQSGPVGHGGAKWGEGRNREEKKTKKKGARGVGGG